ncbi:MAG TPA: ABC transporter permease, partial [Tepidisphaeraceae bacterium]|nr:ABC transporter permease [Tepidisphaeraceae bacterium]
MTSYLIRRLVLFVPTLLGATFIVFLLLFASPSSPVDTLLPPDGNMLPSMKRERQDYLEERYGLHLGPVMQYFRWLNNISPVGFATWERVVSARVRRDQLRAEKEAALRAEGMSGRLIDQQVRQLVVSPSAGDPKLTQPQFKAPDLGRSFFSNRPVAPIILEALPVTISLQMLALPVMIGIALVSGVWSAQHRGKTQDVFTSTVLLAIYSIPVIWAGVMMIGFLANVEFVRAFPAAGLHSTGSEQMPFLPSFSGGFKAGWLLDSLWHLTLPAICVAYGGVPFYSKHTRTALLEALSSDYVRTARAKGLAERIVLYRHAFRNSLIPLITLAASFLPALVTGSIVVETIFSLNGMGRLTIEALKRNDRELFLSTAVVILILQLVGYLIADILYVLADPR